MSKYTISETEVEAYNECPWDWNLFAVCSVSNTIDNYNCTENGKVFSSWEEAQNKIMKSSHLINEVMYCYNHGSLAFSLSPYDCKFDSYPSAIVYLTEQNAKKMFCSENGIKRITKKWLVQYETFLTTLDKKLENAVNSFTDYSNGGTETEYQIVDEDMDFIDSSFDKEEAEKMCEEYNNESELESA